MQQTSYTITILGLGAFGFAVAKYLGDTHPNQSFLAFERNPEITSGLQSRRRHPYFFGDIEDSSLITLPDNIIVQNYDSLYETLTDTDIIISVIPCQFIASAFEELRDRFKPGVMILNLAKGIDNQSLQTAGEKLRDILVSDYEYSYLAGGMIASELIEKKVLGADLIVSGAQENSEKAHFLKELFHSEQLDIKMYFEDPKATELSAALKNIIALVLGYYEGKGYTPSSLGRVLIALLAEIEWLIEEKFGVTKLPFSRYAMGGDLIATCFGASRNRYLGNMLGAGKKLPEALDEMRVQKKISEGYETLKGLKSMIEVFPSNMPLLADFCKKYLS